MEPSNIKISIVIPAHNEEDNIVFLIDALKTQKIDCGQIAEIIVISDGSADRTVELVRSIPDERIRLIVWGKREGLNSAQNKIISEATGDILVILNADILPANNMFIQEIITPILKDAGVGLVSADMTAAKPLGIFEAIIANSYEMKNNIYKALRSQDNIYLCHGQARAFSRAFYEQMHWSDEFPEDAYSYIMFAQKGFLFRFAPLAQVIFRFPQNLSDHLRQSCRFIDGKERLTQSFASSSIHAYYHIPWPLFFREFGKSLAKHPLLTAAYLFIMIFVRMSGWRPSTLQNTKFPNHQKSFSMKNPSVTVAISALNEAQNIAAFLRSVLSQKEEGFVLEKIMVISDGSEDKTAELARSLNSDKIEVREYSERIGKSSRLNEIYKDLQSDILVQSDADVVLEHPFVIRDIILPITSDQKVGMCGGHPRPVPASTFTERAVNCTFNAYEPFRSLIRGGNNVFSADGRLLAFRREFIKQVNVPVDMIANDAFAYFSCLDKGLNYRYVKTAIILFRSPQTFSEQVKQNTRFEAAPARMSKYFRRNS